MPTLTAPPSVPPPPPAWQSVSGHDWAVHVLRSAILHGHVGHAYLFSGPEQVGKTTLARLFAQALNCADPQPAARPCGSCRACRLIAQDRHPDVIRLDPEVSGRGKPGIKIEAIRQLQQMLQLSPYEGRYKIAILRRFDAANPNAANAFLKTLEEPPERVILLLTALEAEALLETIRSRCRVLNLRPLPGPAIEQLLLQRWQADPLQARRLAHLAQGRPGHALTALREPDWLAAHQRHLDWLQQALPGRRVARFQLAAQLAAQPENLPDLLETWMSWWRDAFLLAHGAPESALTHIDLATELQALVRRWPLATPQNCLHQTQTALWQLEHNANTLLVLENLLLSYPAGE